jgi:hypothetical protein
MERICQTNRTNGLLNFTNRLRTRIGLLRLAMGRVIT